MKVLVSVHDVTPAHASRLEQVEDALARWGVERVTYLLVPDFHRRHPVIRNPRFVDWCHRPRPFVVDWTLHGWWHSDTVQRGDGRLTLRDRIRVMLLTRQEGEFLWLTPEQTRERLHWGVEAFSTCLGILPRSFVAPAWLFQPTLFGALREADIRFTEDHRHLYDVLGGRRLACPVITWATRSNFHRAASLAYARAWRGLTTQRPVVRLAIHPLDFDFRAVVASIERVLLSLCSDRQQVHLSGCFGV